MMDHEQIRKLRRELGISQAELWRAAGIHRTILSACETGQLALQGDCARRLVEFFVSRGATVETAEPAGPDMALMGELERVEARIAEIEQSKIDKGFAGLFVVRSEQEREDLSAYLARWRVLVRAMSGKGQADAPILKKPVTHAEQLAYEYRKLRPKDNKAADGT